MVGYEIRFRLGGHQLFSLIERHLENDRIGIFLITPTYEELSFDLQRRRSIRSAFFDIRKRQRDAADSIISDRLRTLHEIRPSAHRYLNANSLAVPCFATIAKMQVRQRTPLACGQGFDYTFLILT